MQNQPSNVLFLNKRSKRSSLLPRGTKELFLSLLGVAATCCGVFFASPYLTVMAMREAVDKCDAEGISKHVDYPALREDLKSRLVSAWLKDADKELKPEIKSMAAARLLNSLVDVMATPEMIGTLMSGRGASYMNLLSFVKVVDQSPQISGRRNNKAVKRTIIHYEEPSLPAFARLSNKAADDAAVSMGFESRDTFVLKARNRTKDEGEITFIFSRNLIFWKLTGIEFP